MARGGVSGSATCEIPIKCDRGRGVYVLQVYVGVQHRGFRVGVCQSQNNVETI